MIAVRCKEKACSKVLANVSEDLRGAVFLKCPRCKSYTSAVADEVTEPYLRLTCLCGKWCAVGRITVGQVRVRCHGCRTMVSFAPDGPRPSFYEPPATEADIVAMVEQRWKAMNLTAARRTSHLAVGLRFQVFQRDGFRCHYCGRSADDGFMLEADHVIPVSRGGSSVLDNLVTACRDCNRGKSDHPIAS